MTSLRDHYLLRHLFRWIDNYRNGHLTAEGIFQNISALMTALEGDVPREIREAFLYVDAEIDTIIYSVSESHQRERIDRVLTELEELIDSYG